MTSRKQGPKSARSVAAGLKAGPGGGTSSSYLQEVDEGSFGSGRAGMGDEDAFYADPLGPAPERPRTAIRAFPEDDFLDEDIGDDLLPE